MYIGLIGYMTAGKTTAAGYFEKQGFTRLHPAHTLRRMLRVFLEDFGYGTDDIDRMLEGDLKRTPIPELGLTPTDLQQTLGTEWGRSLVNPEIWNMILAERRKSVQLTVNDSIRFPNEADTVLKSGGFLLKITRPGQKLNLSHVSEQHVASLPYHFEILNDGTIPELTAKLGVIYSHLLNFNMPYDGYKVTRPH